MTVIRAAMTQTCNAYAPMPPTVDRLLSLKGKLEDVRRANIEHHIDLIHRASKAGAQIVGLGELFAGPYFALERQEFWKALAEDAYTGPTVTALGAVARDLSIVLVAPIYERAGDKRFNTAVVIDADGTPIGSYRKCHIPRGANEAGAFDERFYYEPSDGRMEQPSDRVSSAQPCFPVFHTAVGTIGVAICYDRHFEGVMSTLAAGGAQIIFSPAVTFGEKSRRMWELEFEVDAARHNVFIGGSNRLGSEPPWNQPFFGASHFVGPNGRATNIIDDPNLVIADLDLAELSQPDPSGWNLSRDCRPEIF